MDHKNYQKMFSKNCFQENVKNMKKLRKYTYTTKSARKEKNVGRDDRYSCSVFYKKDNQKSIKFKKPS